MGNFGRVHFERMDKQELLSFNAEVLSIEPLDMYRVLLGQQSHASPMMARVKKFAEEQGFFRTT